MGRRKVDKLLGKKRLSDVKDDKEQKEELEEEEEEEEEEEGNNKNVFIYEESEEESSESEDSKPVQRLFSEKESGFTKGLFDNLPSAKKESKETEKTPLFNFKENKSSLFGDKPLFGSLEKEKKDETEKNIQNNDGEKEEKGEEGDDNFGKSNSPKHEYNPENIENDKDDNNKYVKRYVKKVDKVYLFNKIEKKYMNKGEGFISIETMTTKKDDKEKKDGIFVLRNNIGGLILEGFLNEKINKFDSSEKNGKHFADFVFLINDKDNKLSLTQCKIPFNKKEDLESFHNVYDETIKYINLELKEFSKK